MEAKNFYITKSSDTSADTLLAVGFASILGYIHREVHGTEDGIFIIDSGPYYEITLPFPLNTDNIPRLRDMPMLLPLDSEKQREKQTKKGREGKLDGFNYDAEINRSISYRERLKKLPLYLQTPDARLRREPELEEIIRDEPDTRLGHYQVLKEMIIADSFNELAQRWKELTEEQMKFHIDLLFGLFNNPDNDVTEAKETWKNFAKRQKIPGNVCVSTLQIINPTTGKGANYARASELIRAIGNPDGLWLLELLKFVGFMSAAAPLVIRRNKNRESCKIYVLQPLRIEISQLQYMMSELRAILWPTTAVKLDIVASLRLSQILVKYHQRLYRYHRRRRNLSSIVRGFEVSFYKYMGKAYVMMNIASINLPSWLPDMDSPENVKAAEELLEEHLEVIQHIRNSKGEEGAEEYELLRFYRNFLSGNDLQFFFKFTTAYSNYLIRAGENNRHVQAFTTKGLEYLAMAKQNDDTRLANISSDDSFKHIADAIRQSTITAQYRRTKKKDNTFEVRYGLAQDLKRKASYPKEFMEALGYFLQQYNEETAREEERATKKPPEEQSNRRLRSYVTADDLSGIERLIDKYGSSLICSMLIAHGYALDIPKSEK